MVTTIAADEPHTISVLVGHHAVAINLLLVHPAGAVEWGGDFGGVHQAESDALGERGRGHTTKLTRAAG